MDLRPIHVRHDQAELYPTAGYPTFARSSAIPDKNDESDHWNEEPCVKLPYRVQSEAG